MSSGRNISEIECGAMRVFYGPSGSEVELGLTEDGSVLRIEQEDAEILTEEYGISPVKRVFRGQRAQVDLILKQFDNAQLEAVVFGSQSSAGPTVQQWQFGKQPGDDMGPASPGDNRLRLAPITNASADTDESDSIIIHIAIAEPAPMESRFVNEEAAMIGVRFHALIDESQADGNLLGEWKQDAP